MLTYFTSPDGMHTPAELQSTVTTRLREAADPIRAPQQQRYMKSEMPYLGVTVPECRRIAGSVFRMLPLTTADAWETAILALWRAAAYREERYAAIELLNFPRYAKWIAPERVPLMEELIVTGAWWDYVDAIAGRALGVLLAEYPEPTGALLRGWAVSDNIWKRRSAILAQLRSRRATDTQLLSDVIEPSIGEAEFFLRKGIGWALREYSKTDPEWVMAFLDAHAGLSRLSRREALRHLERLGPLDSAVTRRP